MAADHPGFRTLRDALLALQGQKDLCGAAYLRLGKRLCLFLYCHPGTELALEDPDHPENEEQPPTFQVLSRTTPQVSKILRRRTSLLALLAAIRESHDLTTTQYAPMTWLLDNLLPDHYWAEANPRVHLLRVQGHPGLLKLSFANKTKGDWALHGLTPDNHLVGPLDLPQGPPGEPFDHLKARVELHWLMKHPPVPFLLHGTLHEPRP